MGGFRSRASSRVFVKRCSYCYSSCFAAHDQKWSEDYSAVTALGARLGLAGGTEAASDDVDVLGSFGGTWTGVGPVGTMGAATRMTTSCCRFPAMFEKVKAKARLATRQPAFHKNSCLLLGFGTGVPPHSRQSSYVWFSWYTSCCYLSHTSASPDSEYPCS